MKSITSIRRLVILLYFCKTENITLCILTASLSYKQLLLSKFVCAIIAFIARKLDQPAFTGSSVSSDKYSDAFLILRHLAFSPNRKWTNILHKKESSLIDITYDLVWVSRPYVGLHFGEMRRICGNGSYQVLYRVHSRNPVGETLIYDLPDPHYNLSLPSHEYKPTLVMLSKNNILNRYNLYTGQKYDTVSLGPISFRNLSWNLSGDELVLTSRKSYHPIFKAFTAIKIFNLHPLKHKWCLAFSERIFPGESKDQLGRFKSIELDESLLFLLTDKGHVVCYSLDHVLQSLSEYLEGEFTADDWPLFVKGTPPVLFWTKSHTNTVSFGGFPWMYIKPLSNDLIEIRDLASQDLVGRGVRFDGCYDQKIVPDQLSFHVDGSNRVIHTKNSDLRILSFMDSSGLRSIKCDFQYDKVKERSSSRANSSQGRIRKQKFLLDHSLNRRLAYGFECDLRIFFILEAERYMNYGVKLKHVHFYDIQSCEALSTMELDVLVEGDVETNSLNIFMDKDLLSIISKNKNTSTILIYRLLGKDDPWFVSQNVVFPENRRSHAPGRRRGRRRIFGQRTATSGSTPNQPGTESDDEWLP